MTLTPKERTRSTVPASTSETAGIMQLGEYCMAMRLAPARIARKRSC